MKTTNKKNRQGEITSQQLVLIIILIASFAVILFFIFRLNLGRTTDSEICHNSVVQRSIGKGFAKDLDCKTDYVCISGGDDCEGITAKRTIEVDPENKEEIMNAIADEMADCWWMFGEGKLDYLGLREKGLDKTTCALCSVISFDKTISEKDYQISYREFYNYLNTLKKTQSQTYFNYLYDSDDVDNFQSSISFLKIDIDNNYILDNENYAIVTGFKATARILNWPPLQRYYLYPYYLKTDNLNSELGCQEFVTKA